jgi:peptide-methionine (S)-S-oxide reductase
METAILAGGCFWCLEAVYDDMLGVDSVESGYIGGHIDNPSYKQVCGGMTGHAEAVRVTFDPNVTPFRDLLEVFFTIHDPTTLNRQGNDVGTQYRSAIFYTSPQQQQTALDLVRELESEHVFRERIVTEVVPATTFYVAEGYHQDYFKNNPFQPYCQFAVAPKLKKFREKFTSRRKREGAA